MTRNFSLQFSERLERRMPFALTCGASLDPGDDCPQVGTVSIRKANLGDEGLELQVDVELTEVAAAPEEEELA